MPDIMSEQEAIQCPICQKRFTDAFSSRARSKHISYCRKRHKSGPLSRRKACDECVRSKVRCSTESGGCARCASRNVPCKYWGILQSNDPANEKDSSDTTLVASSEITLVTSNNPSRSMENFTPGFDGIALANREIYSNSTSIFPNGVWRDVLDPEWSHVSDLATTSGEGQPYGLLLETSSIDYDFQNTFSATSQSLRTIPPSPAYRDPPSLFERRRYSEPELELTREHALHILRSYPYMIANQSSVPSFIHPEYQSLSENDTAQPSPLAAALSLAKMLLHGRRMD
ncbi:hypothetical protein EJ08DRAFT_214190 [Tothia fuscella]|uniref:Zn(2)-C6 fungal-type domain-containing protein n=1 Tax=Tothia fuscella TaxID=1048955 RepID=A0A9P4NR89_9PEZI|nr:hypothetical protein EJ08DRAFT_214190 [Tothia fuscella]